MQLYTDADIERLATPTTARVAVRDALVAAHRGQLVSQPRVHAYLGERTLGFASGARPGHWLGYRSYLAPDSTRDEQVITVMDEGQRRARAVAVGSTLGPRRAGAVGAVALEALGPVSPERIGLVGAGTQAWHQLWALPEWFKNVPITVYCRTRARLMEFADRARRELHLDVRCADSADAAVRGADCVILATSSQRPVISGRSLTAARYVTTLGPKQQRSAEFDPEWFSRVWALVTDSPAQLGEYDPANVLVTGGLSDAVVHLGAVLAGEARPRAQRRAFFNVGLAAADPWLLDAIAGGESAIGATPAPAARTAAAIF